jgi:FkbM family methyltransferase
MYPALMDVLAKAPLDVMDVGASGDLHPRWDRFKGGLRAIGFEPDSRAFADLPQTSNRTWINAAVAEHEGECEINVTAAQTATSLLQPNRDLIDEVFADPDSFRIEKTLKVPCTTVDAAARDRKLNVSVLKVDTQGSELAILRGARAALAQTLFAVEVEVEFVELYESQPLFADVDAYMRESGFLLLDLGNFLHHKWRETAHLRGRKGQLISADAFYVLPARRVAERVGASTEPVTALAWACASVAAYGYPELIIRYLRPFSSDKSPVGRFARQLASEVEQRDARAAWRNLRGLGRAANYLTRAADAMDPHHHSAWRFPLGN